MKILYISTACSQDKYAKMKRIYSDALHPAIQTFHYSIMEGLSKNGNDVSSLSGYQIPCNKNKFFNMSIKKENNITFYQPFIINLPVLKQLLTFIFFIITFFFWWIKNIGKEKRVLVDTSYVSISIFMVFLCNLLCLSITGITADIHSYMSAAINKEKKRKSVLKKIISNLSDYSFKHYNSFIFLTDKMNSIINKNNVPYIVLEGIYSKNMETNNEKSPMDKKNITYIGSVYEKYGIVNLIEAFKKIKNKDIELHLCGPTEMDDYVKQAMKKDSRIKYKGFLDYDQVLQEERRAYILVNPRPTNEEYTMYSFPSKTMEYLASGNITVSTKLAGIPDEYDEYINYFDGYEIDDIKNKLIYLLDEKNKKKLLKKAHDARDFILNNKTDVKQGKRIVDLIKKNCDVRNDIMLFLEKIALVIMTITSILPNYSNRYLFGGALIIWLLSVIPILQKTKFSLLKHNKIVFISLSFLLINAIINLVFDRMDLLSKYIFSYIRIISIIIIALFYSGNQECFKKNIKIIYIITLLIVFYSSLKTGIYNLNNYNISRIISTGIDLEKYKNINNVGFGNYQYIYGIIYLIFILMAFIIKSIRKNDKCTFVNVSVVLVLVVSVFCLIKAEFMYSFILLFIIIVMYVFKINSIKKIIISFVSLILLLTVLRIPISKALDKVAPHINKPNIEMRLNDISLMLKGNISDTIDVKARLNNYLISINTFIDNPLYGVGFNVNDARIGLHSTFLDEFAKFGLVGGLTFVTFIVSSLFAVWKSFKSKTKDLYFYCAVTFLVFMAINNAMLVTIFYFVYIIVPVCLKYMEVNYESVMDS